MGWIKRKWTPQEADEWTKEDWIAIVLSPLSFIFITFGLAMSLFLLPAGFVMLLIGIVITAVMFWIINPKLDVLSVEYEHKQKEFLEDLERIQRWGEDK
jgi:antibiotic biosynthesis monooxygenase (ABM) superfamily enzyme